MRPRWWPATDPAPTVTAAVAVDQGAAPTASAAPASPRRDSGPRDSGAGLLSWDVEDDALAARRCPWCAWSQPGPDPGPLLRHVVGHARAWEAEAMAAERQRRALAARVAGFGADVSRLAGELTEAAS